VVMKVSKPAAPVDTFAITLTKDGSQGSLAMRGRTPWPRWHIPSSEWGAVGRSRPHCPIRFSKANLDSKTPAVQAEPP